MIDKIAIARQIIKEVSIIKSRKLSLAGLNLTDEDFELLLPEIIEKLPDLEMLYLRNNQLTSLSDRIAELKHLKKLDASSNKLTEVTPAIGNLTGLTELLLSDNQLADLPEELAQLTQLEHLNIAQNQFTDLPEELAQLTQLEHLNIAQNQFTTFPVVLTRLQHLKSLYLYKNQLAALPSEIGNLIGLEHIYANDNLFTSIPTEIGKLTALKTLELSNNQIATLPDSVRQLEALEYFYLDNNQLQTLPQSLAELQNLQHLNVSNNPLTEETRYWLDQSFQGRVRYNMVTFDTPARDHKSVLKELYKNNPEAGARTPLKIENLRRVKNVAIGQKVVVEAGQRKTVPARTVSGDVVLKEFLAKLPEYNDPKLQSICTITVKYLLDQLKGSEDTATMNSIAEMATCLNDCSTPFINFILQKAIGIASTHPDLFKGLDMELIIEREAVQEKIEREILLTSGDKQEEVQGLVNAIYLDTKAIDPDNKAKFTGNRAFLTSKTGTISFAYRQVKNEQVIALAKIVGKTDKEGAPIQDQEGRYEIDPQKIKDIKTKYLQKRGLLYNPVESGAGQIEQHIKENYRYLGYDYHEKEDVTAMLDWDIHKTELAERIKALPPDASQNEMEQIVKEYVTAVEQELIALNKKYPEKKSSIAVSLQDLTKLPATRRKDSIQSTETQSTTNSNRRLHILAGARGW